LDYRCGIVSNALQMNDGDDVFFIGPVNDEFDSEDFTVSLYFKASDLINTQYLLSKRWEDCRSENVFNVRYSPTANSLNAFVAESPNKAISLTASLNPDRCWYHVVVWRQGPEVRLYIDGELIDSRRTTSRIELTNPGNLMLGSSDCKSPNERNFSGLIDEFRVYNRALRGFEIDELYLAPDQIETPNALIFEGESVDIELSSTCASSFQWFPITGVDNPSSPNPTITPLSPGLSFYTVQFRDTITSCVALDSIEINVIDPDDLDCNNIFLPNAFTPNNDGLNDEFGISNPFAIPQLISFEIYNRSGERLFVTDDPFATWDGNYDGQEINSSVLKYVIRYVCKGEELFITGSTNLMR
ncbi:MAG: LamG-like jellyroll fold domain-containing protein, partial [Bacteroidota bacterium]